ncbi:MAG: 4-hydroxy-3-methylbut-2-enyl diphosphate reductase [Elusimicrobiales bacterium]|nr:4-hydroxy-3-methylbut-2-enyl diphosphate reductase [Elusimicrobiales bacterium]
MAEKIKIIVARHAGFCPGVKKAIDMTLELARNRKQPIYTLGPLIHNRQVIETLEEKNIKAVSDISNIKDTNSILVIRAHGIPRKEEEKLRATSMEIIDATCPLVKKVHSNIADYSKKGYATIIVGDKDHAEVIGLMSYAENNCHVISGIAQALKLPNFKKANIVAQTTQEEKIFNACVEAVRDKTDELVVSNTICTPTKERQTETMEFAKDCDLVIVVGGRNSANTQRLFKICSKLTKEAIHIEKDDELPSDALNDKKNIFITAGASTPHWMIEKVLEKVRDLSKKEKSFLAEKLTFLGKLFVTGSLYTALSAMALTYICMNLESVKIDPRLIILSGLFVASLHILHRMAEKGSVVPDRAQRFLFTRFKNSVKTIGILFGIASIAISAFFGIKIFILTALLWLVGIFYPYKAFTGLNKFSNFPASKDIVTALGWTFVCAGLPAIAGETLIYKSSQLALLFALLLVFMRSVLLGISNVHNDMIVGNENFYKAAGPKLTYLIVTLIFIFLEIVLITLFNMGWKEVLSRTMFFGLFYYMVIMVLFFFKKIPERISSETIIDFQFIFLGLLAFVAA